MKPGTSLLRPRGSSSRALRDPHEPSTPPPSPFSNFLADPSSDNMPDDLRTVDDSPSDEEQHTFSSQSLCAPRDHRDDATVAHDGNDGGSKGAPTSGLVKAKAALQKYNPTLTLENSGSVARDHLASERTFLAYVRTSLTIASTGVALVQLFTISAATSNKAIQKYSKPLGAIVIILGLCTLLFGAVRYFTIQNALLSGNYPVARVSTIMLALILGAIIVVVFGIIVGVRTQ
ncbi:hypothetical protein EIP86_010678 [Pleurotus ostreatoroseus]|nr:hypothetical protein EIP86_010678 [Pleurotus ostreatoroseus]